MKRIIGSLFGKPHRINKLQKTSKSVSVSKKLNYVEITTEDPRKGNKVHEALKRRYPSLPITFKVSRHRHGSMMINTVIIRVPRKESDIEQFVASELNTRLSE